MPVRNVLVALSLVLASCAKGTYGEPYVITLQGETCVGCYSTFVITSDGTFSDQTDPRNTISVKNAAEQKQLFDSLPNDELAYGATHAVAVTTDRIVRVTSYTTQKRTLDATVPVMGGVPYEVSRLSLWADRAFGIARRVTNGPRIEDIGFAVQHHTLRYIRVEMLGCYGDCPAYSATFFPTGSATLELLGSGCSKRAHARIAFDRVANHARALAFLQGYYPIHAVDTRQARITIATPKTVYTSYGPDETTWSADFASTLSRWDQLIQDTAWTPPTSTSDCTRHAALRRR